MVVQILTHLNRAKLVAVINSSFDVEFCPGLWEQGFESLPARMTSFDESLNSVDGGGVCYLGV